MTVKERHEGRATEGAGTTSKRPVVLGTLSVLRSNALSTGQSALRGLVGTTIGFAVV